MSYNPVIFPGTSNPRLAASVAEQLGTTLGSVSVRRHPDDEVLIALETPVAGREMFIIQPTSPPVDRHLMELLAFADAGRRADARRIVAVVPYFGYARADKRKHNGEPIMGSLVAQLIEAAGVDAIITVDMHTPQLEGFFGIPVRGVSAVDLLADAVADRLPPDTLVVSPDAGRAQMAATFAARLHSDVVVLHKERKSGTQAEVACVIGDVRGRHCLLVDDMISTGGTLVASITALRDAGAHPQVHVAATHGLFLGDAIPRLEGLHVASIHVTDSVATRSLQTTVDIQVISVAELLAGAISAGKLMK